MILKAEVAEGFKGKSGTLNSSLKVGFRLWEDEYITVDFFVEEASESGRLPGLEIIANPSLKNEISFDEIFWWLSVSFLLEDYESLLF